MTQDEIRAIALEVAKELLDEPLNIGQAEHYTDFATRFLAAITAKAEPDYRSIADAVVRNLEGRKQVINLDLDEELVEEIMQEMTDTIRDGFTHPAIEPAPQESRPVTVSDATRKSPVGAAPLNASPEANWTEDFAHENGQYQCLCCKCEKVFMGHKRRTVCKLCAPPLPDDVAKMASRLRYAESRASNYGHVMLEAADMIEHLARQLQEVKDWNAMLADHNEQLAQRGDDLEEHLARQVPQEAIALAKDMVDGHYPNHREYIVANALLIAAGEVK